MDRKVFVDFVGYVMNSRVRHPVAIFIADVKSLLKGINQFTTNKSFDRKMIVLRAIYRVGNKQIH